MLSKIREGSMVGLLDFPSGGQDKDSLSNSAGHDFFSCINSFTSLHVL